MNADVLAVVEQVWAEGGGVAEVPSKQDLVLPRPPAPRFALHSTGTQLLCHGSKPMVRVWSAGGTRRLVV